MKRARYCDGVAWIALNDDAGASDAKDESTVASYISTLLLADLFDKKPEHVARDIVQFRLRQDAYEARWGEDT